VTEAFQRLGVQAPTRIGGAHLEAIAVEAERLGRAIDAGDDGQALGYLKCLVEAVAKIVLDLNGEPVAGNASFDTIVGNAHGLLARQRGVELARDSPFANLTTQARKMAVSMSTIRNEFGGGHGRARQPELTPEMLTLAMDGSLLWVRWAVRRLDAFAEGRPETLIRDLVGDPDGVISFYRGSLAQRLASSGLAEIEPRHARAIGVAVGQRAARDTFNVRIDGVDPPANDPDLHRWPAPYRLGVARGLLFAPDERTTFTAYNLLEALQVCLPVIDASEEMGDLIRAVLQAVPPGQLPGNPESTASLTWLIDQNVQSRPAAEQADWAALGLHLRGLVPPA
jgi:hypothetical protein